MVCCVSPASLWPRHRPRLPHYLKTILVFEGSGQSIPDGGVVVNKQYADLLSLSGFLQLLWSTSSKRTFVPLVGSLSIFSSPPRWLALSRIARMLTPPPVPVAVVGARRLGRIEASAIIFYLSKEYTVRNGYSYEGVCGL